MQSLLSVLLVLFLRWTFVYLRASALPTADPAPVAANGRGDWCVPNGDPTEGLLRAAPQRARAVSDPAGTCR